MKKILFLLLFTIASYGQAVFDEGIQITNTESTTATKVNVQEANGTINTISKSDLVNVVEVNDVPSLPLIGEAGKIYVVKNLNKIYRWNGTFYQELTTDISGKEDIANKQNSLAVDGTNTKYPTVTAVNTGLALKANLASPALTGTPTAPTATVGTNTTQIATTAFVTGAISTADSGNVKLTGNQSIAGIKSFTSIISSTGGITVSNPTGSNFLANQTTGSNFNYIGQNSGTDTFTVDKLGATTATSFIKSSAPPTNILLAGGGDIAQSTFQPSITGLTTNYLPKWNGSGFGNSQIFDDGGNVGIGTNTPPAKLSVAGNIISVMGDTYPTIGATNYGSVGFPLVQLQNIKNGVNKAWNIENGRIVNGDLGFYNEGGQRITFTTNGRVLINKTDDDLTNQLQVAGTISASPATTANQVVVKSQLDAVAARPYKVYTALLTQILTSAPTATVLENTLGGTISFSRVSTGIYRISLTGAFTVNKTWFSYTRGTTSNALNVTNGIRRVDNDTIEFNSVVNGSFFDGQTTNDTIEIRVYL